MFLQDLRQDEDLLHHPGFFLTFNAHITMLYNSGDLQRIQKRESVLLELIPHQPSSPSSRVTSSGKENFDGKM